MSDCRFGIGAQLEANCCRASSSLIFGAERQRTPSWRMVWPIGPECPHCGNTDRIGSVTGKGARTGLKLCCRCRKQFRVTMASIFDCSHVPLQKWLQACFLLVCCDSRITVHQLHLTLEMTNKTALRMVQRLDPLATGLRREFRRSEAETGRPRPGIAEAEVWAEAVGLALGTTRRKATAKVRGQSLSTVPAG